MNEHGGRTQAGNVVAAGKIEVPLDDIRAMWSRLGKIASEFSKAEPRSNTAADAVGHPGLAGAIRHFSGSWDDRRAKLNDQLSTLEKQAKDVAEGFSAVDSSLADALTPKSE